MEMTARNGNLNSNSEFSNLNDPSILLYVSTVLYRIIWNQSPLGE